jgi:cytoskeletal protein CcmA (bactofilin family)
MTEQALGNVKISGSGTVAGGCYDTVRISGSGHIQGAIEVNELRVSGSATADGTVNAATISISGAATLNGAVTATSCSISGATKVTGDVEVGELRSSGSCKVGGRLKARECHISGSLQVQDAVNVDGLLRMSGTARFGGDIEAAHLQTTCALQVDGLLNADTVELVLLGQVSAREVGGERIIVLHPGRRIGEGWALPSCVFSLTTATVEGDELFLEATRAAVVRGKRIVIGPHCRITRVEYGDSLCIDPTATVEESVYTGGDATPPVVERQATTPPAGWAREQALSMRLGGLAGIALCNNPLLAVLIGLAVLLPVLLLILPLIGVVLSGVGILLLVLLLVVPVLVILAVILKTLSCSVTRWKR